MINFQNRQDPPLRYRSLWWIYANSLQGGWDVLCSVATVVTANNQQFESGTAEQIVLFNIFRKLLAAQQYCSPTIAIFDALWKPFSSSFIHFYEVGLFISAFPMERKLPVTAKVKIKFFSVSQRFCGVFFSRNSLKHLRPSDFKNGNYKNGLYFGRNHVFHFANSNLGHQLSTAKSGNSLSLVACWRGKRKKKMSVIN